MQLPFNASCCWRSCMYLPQAVQTKYYGNRHKSWFREIFSLDKACKTMLYVFTANRTKRSLAEKAQNLDFQYFFVRQGVCSGAVCIYCELHRTKYGGKKTKNHPWNIVPKPSSVNNSIRIECGIRPSIMLVWRTPRRTASTQQSISVSYRWR